MDNTESLIGNANEQALVNRFSLRQTASVSNRNTRREIFIIESGEAMSQLGRDLASQFRSRPMLIFLVGDLGVGKTTLTQGFVAEQLSRNLPIQSPTFAYMRQYLGDHPIFHFDLYRIESADEVFELGLKDYLDDEHTTRLVEWPERLADFVRPPDIVITITIIDGLYRKVEITYLSA